MKSVKSILNTGRRNVFVSRWMALRPEHHGFTSNEVALSKSYTTVPYALLSFVSTLERVCHFDEFVYTIIFGTKKSSDLTVTVQMLKQSIDLHQWFFNWCSAEP